MQNLKYYVLGTKNSPLLKEYLEKYYEKLVDNLKKLKKQGILSQEIKELLKIENKDFVLNGDISSLINAIDNNFIYENSIKKLQKEIKIFLEEGINSKKLTQNKGKKIINTNIRLTDIDNNPYNLEEAHPEHKKSGAISGNWGEKTEDKWLEIYKKSFDLLKKLDEGFYDELNQIITKIIPLGTARNIHNSASYKECIGHLYMGYTIDASNPEINNLEAIIHESSHNKLNLILQFDPIVLNKVEYKYYSAIRPDARHLQGVFLGYHAFAPTMYVVMKAYLNGDLGDDKMWYEKIILYYLKTKFLQKVIHKYAILTDIGKEISKEIDYVIRQMDILFKKLNPSKQDILIAKQKQTEHFNQVNINYPFLEY